MQSFRNKVVVITGAGSGMGRAYAVAFAREGARLALNDWEEVALAETLALVGEGHLGRAFDVGDRAEMRAFAELVRQTLGDASVVINNAGIEGAVAPAWQISDADMDRVMRVNFQGVVNGCVAFLPQLLRQPEGAVVNISSVFGLVGPPLSADYAASKFAVRGYTESLMAELHGSRVSVHLVHPGGIATRIARQDSSQAFKEKYLRTPPEEIAQHVLAAIRGHQARVIKGHQAWLLRLASVAVPQWLLTRLMARELGELYPDVPLGARAHDTVSDPNAKPASEAS